MYTINIILDYLIDAKDKPIFLTISRKFNELLNLNQSFKMAMRQTGLENLPSKMDKLNVQAAGLSGFCSGLLTSIQKIITPEQRLKYREDFLKSSNNQKEKILSISDAQKRLSKHTKIDSSEFDKKIYEAIHCLEEIKLALESSNSVTDDAVKTPSFK
jgi:hypothetical protein